MIKLLRQIFSHDKTHAASSDYTQKLIKEYRGIIRDLSVNGKAHEHKAEIENMHRLIGQLEND